MSKKFYFSRRAASGRGKDLSCGYESGDILAGDSDNDVCNQYSAESEGIMCESSEADESSGEDSESSSEPEMDFPHKNKKSRVSASDEITPSRSVLPQGRRVLAPKSDPTHKRKQIHRSSSRRARSFNPSPSDQRQSNEVVAALSEITNTLTKVVARLDTQEKILKKITMSASSSSSCSESQKTKVPLIVRVSKSLCCKCSYWVFYFFLLVFFFSQKLEECIKPSVMMILNSLASTLTMGKVHAVSFIHTVIHFSHPSLLLSVHM